jgi:hypothetical protein
MAAIGNFDATQVAPAAPREAIPAGWYNCSMVKSDKKMTKNNNGSYLEVTFEVLDGPYARSQVIDNINLENQNPVAVEIGYRTLSAICHAVQVMQVQDTAILHNRPLQVNVGLRPAGPGNDGKHYEASNDVKGYKAIGGAVAQSAPVAPPAPVVQSTPLAYQPPAFQQPAPAPVYAPLAFQAPTQPPAQPAPAAPLAPPAQPAPVYQQQPAPVQPAAPLPWEQPQQAPQQPVAAEIPPWAQQPQA